MKKTIKSLLMLFIFIRSPVSMKLLFPMAKSPTTPRKEIWHFKEPMANSIKFGKTGSCISTTIEEIKNICSTLLNLFKKNSTLFIKLIWLNSKVDLQLQETELNHLKEIGLLSPRESKENKGVPLLAYNAQIPLIVSKLLDLICELKQGKVQIKCFQELINEQMLEKID